MAFDFDVCVIGSGPGGYVAAIRASQLGLKTCVIEREKLGGVCLNVGCIPSKALISAASFFHRIQHDAPTMGIQTSKVSLNPETLQKWKTTVCDRMSTGVKQLLQGNKAETIMGEANFISPQELEVKSATGVRKIKAKNAHTYFI